MNKFWYVIYSGGLIMSSVSLSMYELSVLDIPLPCMLPTHTEIDLNLGL